MTELRTTSHRAPIPVLRAAVFAVVGTVLGMSAHHLVAEGPVPWRQSAATVAVLFAVGLLGAQRPRSLASVVAACGGAQVGLHLWLTVLHAHHTPTPGATMPMHEHRGMGAHTAWHERLHDSLAMTAVHAVAAVVVAILLHRADTVCWSLARGLTTAVDAVRRHIATACTLLTKSTSPAETGLSAPARAWLERPPLKGALLADVVVRRGPPRAGHAHAI